MSTSQQNTQTSATASNPSMRSHMNHPLCHSNSHSNSHSPEPSWYRSGFEEKENSTDNSVRHGDLRRIDSGLLRLFAGGIGEEGEEEEEEEVVVVKDTRHQKFGRGLDAIINSLNATMSEKAVEDTSLQGDPSESKVSYDFLEANESNNVESEDVSEVAPWSGSGVNSPSPASPVHSPAPRSSRLGGTSQLMGRSAGNSVSGSTTVSPYASPKSEDTNGTSKEANKESNAESNKGSNIQSSKESNKESSKGSNKRTPRSGLEVEGEVYDLLLVDDSSLNRKMLGKVFRLAGYLCDEAFDGVSAVEKVKQRMMEVEAQETDEGGRRKRHYDAILMDFVMPIMDGPTATSVIRSLGFTNPIFGVTGNTLDSDIQYFISKGVNAVLPKPFDFIHFKQLMKNALGEAKEAENRRQYISSAE